MSQPRSLRVDPRFQGPPTSANGGYIAGLLARQVAGVATVRLFAPPPLQRELQLREEDAGWRLYDGEQPLAQVRPGALDAPAPQAPNLAQAEAAVARFAGFQAHPFPRCFVCGPARGVGDGLRIFPGVVDGRDLVAAPWQPSGDLLDARGKVADEFLWAALDCSGYFAFAGELAGRPALLGELSARIDAAVTGTDPLIVVGWANGQSGRKRFAGSALYDREGRLLAQAQATWIVLDAG